MLVTRSISAALLAASLLPVGVASAETFDVKANFDAALDPFAPPCVCRLSEEDPTCTLRAAIQAANACPGHDVVQLLETGPYTLSIPGAGEDDGATGDLDILEELSFLGNGEQVRTEVEDRVFDVQVHEGPVDMIGVRITNGNAGWEYGGGIRVQDSELLLQEVVLDENHAYVGGGLGAYQSHVMVLDSVMRGNAAQYGGGAGLLGSGPLASATAILEGVLFEQNTAVYGGGFTVQTSELDAVGLEVIENAAGVYGGGAHLTGLHPKAVRSSTFVANQAQYGGGVSMMMIQSYPDLRLEECTFAYNAAVGSGLALGGGVAGGGHVERSTFIGNSARWGGGASPLPPGFGELVVRTSTFVGNSASESGGGMAGYAGYGGGEAVAEHVTFFNNSAPAGAATWTTRLHASLVVGPPQSSLCWATTSDGFNIDTDGSCLGADTDQTVLDAGLGPSGTFGGTTLTYSLLASSPAVDAGDPSFCLPEDQAGQPRPSGVRCDVGAFEYQYP